MNNKQRREIIENAKASGYDGSYVDLFRDPAAPLKLAVTEEERMKGLKPYNEPGGQAMALPNNPPNNPVNTIGARPPIRTKSVGSKVGSAPVAPGISSFKGVVTAGDLRARGKYGRRRAEEGTQRPPEATANPALFDPTSVPITEEDIISKELDQAQLALGVGSVGAGVTGIGEIASAPMDLFNAGLSARRALGYATKGKYAKAAEYAGIGALNLVAALPFIGNLAQGAATAKLTANIANTAKGAQILKASRAAGHGVESAAHAMHKGGEAVITGYKGIKYGYNELKEEEDATRAQFVQNTLPGSDKLNELASQSLRRGGYTNKFGRVRRLTGGPENEVPQPVGGPETPFETSRRFQPVDAQGNAAEGLTNKWDVQALGETWDEQVDRFHETHGTGKNSILNKKRRDRIKATKDILREDKLDLQVSNYMSNMWDFENNKPRREDDPQAAMYINKMFSEVGLPDADSVNTPWSAATVSHLAKAIHPDFKGSPLHADYINRGFNKEGTHKTRKIKWNDEFQVGDILFQGREDTRGWSYKDFKNASKKGQRYPSHTDIIVGKGTDEDGRVYYEVMGGNTGGEKDSNGKSVDGTQVTKYRKMYPDNIKGNYQGALVTGRKKEKEERKEAKKILAGSSSRARQEKRAKKKASRKAPKPNEPDLNLDSIEMEEENIPVFEWDKGNRRKRGGRLRDRRRKARRRK